MSRHHVTRCTEPCHQQFDNKIANGIQSFRGSQGDYMSGLSNVMTYLLGISGLCSAVLVVMVIYGNTLDIRDDEELYLNKTEEKIMGGDQPALISKMKSLAQAIKVLAIITGIFLLVTAGIWVYIGLNKS